MYEMTDDELKKEYHKLYNNMLKIQVEYTSAKNLFDIARKMCVKRGLRKRTKTGWVWINQVGD